MNRVIVCWGLLLFFVNLSLAQQPASSPVWNVTLQPNSTASSNISVVNSCSQKHNFQIQPQNVPFLNINQNQVQVNGGQTVSVPVQFNTQNMSPGNYRGQVFMICLTCRSEPTCNQDREVLQLVLNVAPPAANQPNDPPNPGPQNPPGNPAAGNPPNAGTTTGDSWDSIPKKKIPLVSAIFDGFLKGPCAIMEIDCEKLRLLAAQAEAGAADAQAKADAAKAAAAQTEQKAKDAEEAARKAAALVQPEGPTNAVVDGEGYTEADSAYLQTLRDRNNADLAAGKISTTQHQARANSLTTKVAREERLAEQAKLIKEAEEAKKKANAERAAANAANAAAAAVQGEADAAKQAAAAALEAYKKCLKQLEDECKRQQEAKAAAEKKKKEDEARVAAAASEAEKKKKEDEERAKAAAERAAALAAERDYLLDNIKKLGLISSTPFKDVPGAFDAVIDKIVPDILGKTVEQVVSEMVSGAADYTANGPIPIGSIQALGGLYQVMGAMLDPCTKEGELQTANRLTGMINPKTKPPRNYTLEEGQVKTQKMCVLLKELKSKLQAVKAAQEAQSK